MANEYASRNILSLPNQHRYGGNYQRPPGGLGAATSIPSIPDTVPKELLKKSTLRVLLYDAAGMSHGKDYEFIPGGILLKGDGFAKLNNTINDQFIYARSFESFAEMYRDLGETAKAQNACQVGPERRRREGQQLRSLLGASHTTTGSRRSRLCSLSVGPGHYKCGGLGCLFLLSRPHFRAAR